MKVITIIIALGCIVFTLYQGKKLYELIKERKANKKAKPVMPDVNIPDKQSKTK